MTSKTTRAGPLGAPTSGAMLGTEPHAAPEAMSIDLTEELRLLAALCRELAPLGLDVGMSDAAPAVSVRSGRANPRLWVSVNVRDGFFTWQTAVSRRHPTADATGAAKLIASDARAVRA